LKKRLVENGLLFFVAAGANAALPSVLHSCHGFLASPTGGLGVDKVMIKEKQNTLFLRVKD